MSMRVGLARAKTGPVSVAAGGTELSTITVTTLGPGTAANVTVTDALPSGLALATATVVPGSMSLAATPAGLVATAPPRLAGAGAVNPPSGQLGPALVGPSCHVVSVPLNTRESHPRT